MASYKRKGAFHWFFLMGIFMLCFFFFSVPVSYALLPNQTQTRNGPAVLEISPKLSAISHGEWVDIVATAHIDDATEINGSVFIEFGNDEIAIDDIQTVSAGIDEVSVISQSTGPLVLAKKRTFVGNTFTVEVKVKPKKTGTFHISGLAVLSGKIFGMQNFQYFPISRSEYPSVLVKEIETQKFLNYNVGQIFHLSGTQGTLTVTAVENLEYGFKKITFKQNGPGYQSGGFSDVKVITPNGQFIDASGRVVGTDPVTAPWQSNSFSGYRQALDNLKDTNQPLLQQQYREQYGVNALQSPSPSPSISPLNLGPLPPNGPSVYSQPPLASAIPPPPVSPPFPISESSLITSPFVSPTPIMPSPQTPVLVLPSSQPPRSIKNFAVSGIDFFDSFRPENIRDLNSIWKNIKGNNPFEVLFKTILLKIKVGTKNNKIENEFNTNSLFGKGSKYLADYLSRDTGVQFIPIPWSLDWQDCLNQEVAKQNLIAKIINAYKENSEINIVTHSHGTIIAYNALKQLEKSHPNLTINNFISMGTIIEPLHYIPIVNPSDKMCLSSTNFTRPHNVGHWVNIYSKEDEALSQEIKIAHDNILWTLDPPHHSQYYQDKTLLRFISQCVEGECSLNTFRKLITKPIIVIPTPPNTSCEQNLGIKCPDKSPPLNTSPGFFGSVTPAPKPIIVPSPLSNPIRISNNVFTDNLYQGMKNDRVIALQKLLKERGFFSAGILITGYFGNITKEAVQKFQVYYGIAPSNGYVGSVTRAKLNALLLAH